ncbi:histone H1 [Humulus lupulus]|uniref:histone H1 n=1 Tax=Humulus lupulus TaxID=3486 RepID=UPI002B4117F8|nr:histone H1 [Humulus lupulus]
MTTAAETKAPAVEVAPATVPVESKKAAKPVKEKKPKVPKEKKPKQSKTASHPPYFQMIKEAVLALKEKSGSSPYAIAKYMEEKHKAVLPANFKKMLGLQLKNSTSKGKLIKIKASYKLSEAGKKEKLATKVTKAKAVKKTKVAKTKSVAAPKTRATQKPKAEKVKKATNVAKKKKAKKSTPMKPKQPKSIKSPAAKRVKKAAA